jgi:3-oxoacyl-[acyl-carrier-protein] synthase II
MPRPRVVVTGFGCISPVGNDVENTWRSLLTGRSGVGPITHFDASELKTKIAAEVRDFEPRDHLDAKLARRTDRFTHFALTAAGQALKHAGLGINSHNKDRAGVFVGTGIGGVNALIQNSEKMAQQGPHRVSPFFVTMMLPDAAAAQIAIEFHLRGPNMAVVTACASSANAIGEAAETIRRGDADVMVAGGSEAAIVPIAVAGLNVMDAISTRNDDPTAASRPFDLDRDGFVFGEGSAVVILESFKHAVARGATIHAEVSGYATTNDAYHVAAPAENGAGAAKCMRIALENAGLSPHHIGYINAHGTSTRLNDANETKAIKTIFGKSAYEVPISSTKSMTGHLLGAAGALESIVCIMALKEGKLPPTINYNTPDPECDLDYVPNHSRQAEIEHAMTNSFGLGGHNACLIFSKPTLG